MVPTSYANATKFYVDGTWVEPVSTAVLDVINPATEEVISRVALGGEQDDLAVAAEITAIMGVRTS
jgi:aldehyde dehydrogenase (NAD+)